jgi:hypothetical protein
MLSAPRFLFWTLLLLGFAQYADCPAQELPPEALDLVKAIEKKTAVAKQRYAKEFAEWRQGMTEKLKSVQRKLAEEDRLEEAILVRDLAKVYATGNKTLAANPASPATPYLSRILQEANSPALRDVNFAEPVSQEQFAALPKEAQTVLLENEYFGGEKDFVESALRDQFAELHQKLVELKSKYTREGKLDEAVAIRTWLVANLEARIRSESRSAEILKPVVPDIAAGAKDVNAIQANYGAAVQASTTYLEQAHATSVDSLIGRLQPLQAVYAQAERLDDALSVRELVRKIKAVPGAKARVAAVYSARSQLPEEARNEVDAFLAEVEPLVKEWERTIENLNTQLLQPLKENAAKAIINGNVDEARRTLAALYFHRKERFPLAETHRREPLVVSEETQEVVDAFRDAAQKRIDAADAADAVLREALLIKLREGQARNLKFDEEIALDASIRFLESPDHAGIREALLFQRNPNLKGDLAELVAAYVRENRAAFRTLEQQHREGFEEFGPRLQVIRTKQVEAEDWKAAFSTLLAQQDPPGVFEPIPIAFHRFPHTRGIEATVIGFKDGLYRVRQSPNRESWALREEIRIGDEKPPELTDNEAPPPGGAVDRRTQLTSGQLLLTKKGGWTWDVVQVVEAGVDTVKVRYPDRANWEEVLERANLRIIPEE